MRKEVAVIVVVVILAVAAVAYFIHPPNQCVYKDNSLARQYDKSSDGYQCQFQGGVLQWVNLKATPTPASTPLRGACKHNGNIYPHGRSQLIESIWQLCQSGKWVIR